MKAGPRPAHERISRLLVMLPWLAQRGKVTVADMAATFGVSERELVKDLEIASLCGLPPYVDELVDLYVDDGWVYAGVPRLFTRPPRLTAAEGFTLLAAGRAALELPGAEVNGALARALDKLEAVLGARPDVTVKLERPPLLDVVQEAVDRSRRLAVTYYTFTRDETTERVLAPHAVYPDRGRWYVIADDSLSGEERHFRVDRIESATLTDEAFVRREVELPADGGLSPSAEHRIVTLLVEPEARWVVERTPALSAEPTGDGRTRIRLEVTRDRWLESLLLQAGPQVTVEDPPELDHLGRDAAQRLLARYRSR
jgi:proteasome accessory factor C